MRVVLLDEAQREFEARDAWWHTHRDEPELFLLEFEQALVHLTAAPEAGHVYRTHRGREIRRWLMRKTRCHIYYHYNRASAVLEIHSFWGARRAQSPRRLRRGSE